MPKLSIITVNYNNRAGLEKTIKSVIEQGFKDYEYIVVDGGSDDGSVDIIKQNEAKINWWVSEKDTGIYNAMNKGLNKAAGEYCLFLNSGDYLYNNDVLANVFNLGYTEDIIYGNMIIEYNTRQSWLGEMPELITFEHMIQDTIWHPVSFIKRALFLKYGYYREDLTIASDYDFLLNTIIVNKGSTKHIPITVSVFLLDGISSKPKNRDILKKERRNVQLKYFSQTAIDSVPKRKTVKRNILYRAIGFLKRKIQ